MRSSSSRTSMREALDSFFIGFLWVASRFCSSFANSLSWRLKGSRKGCLRASSTVKRSVASIRRQALMKLKAFFSILPRQRVSMESVRFTWGSSISANLRLFLKQSCWWGVRSPTDFWMMQSWSISSSPGNMGCPSTSSPTMHPTAHMSAAFPYGSPTSNSGERYHRVATYSVRSYSASGRNLANPKSQILSWE